MEYVLYHNKIRLEINKRNNSKVSKHIKINQGSFENSHVVLFPLIISKVFKKKKSYPVHHLSVLSVLQDLEKKIVREVKAQKRGITSPT